MPLGFWFAAVPLLVILVPTLISTARHQENEKANRYVAFVGWMAAYSMVALVLGFPATLVVLSVYGAVPGTVYLLYIPAVTLAVSVATALIILKTSQRGQLPVSHPACTVKVPIIGVVGVMTLLLVVDCGLTWLLASLDVNVFVVHMVLMAAGIFLGGAASMLGAEHFPKIAISICGGLLISFLLVLMLPTEPATAERQPSPDLDVVFMLIFAAVLCGVSYAICKQFKVYLAERSPQTRAGRTERSETDANE